MVHIIWKTFRCISFDLSLHVPCEFMQNDEFAVDDIVLLVECGAVPAVLGLLSKVLLDGKCVVRTAVEKMSAAVNLAVNTGDAYKSFA